MTKLDRKTVRKYLKEINLPVSVRKVKQPSKLEAFKLRIIIYVNGNYYDVNDDYYHVNALIFTLAGARGFELL